VRQTLIVTIDVTDKTDPQLGETMQRLFELPESRDGRLKYNLVDIAQDDVIAAEHAMIDIVHRARKALP
jgi:hypothetical protein